MSKLNKTQTNSLVATTVANIIEANTELFKKDKSAAFQELLTNALATILAPKSGGGTSTKIDDNGDVYCNYFDTYMDAKYFNTKLGKANKTTGERIEGYKANSITAEQILRKIKSLKAMVNRQVIENFKAKTINADEMDKILADLDIACQTPYITVDDVPTVADVVGLTAEMTANDTETLA